MTDDVIYYECLECGERDQTDFEPIICERCQRFDHFDSENVKEIEAPPENGGRIYCPDCDFEETILEDDAERPLELLNGRLQLHRSSGHNPQTEYCPESLKDSDEVRSGVCPSLDSEDELQEWLESYFEDNGWTAIREVSPHRSNYSADLIVQHDKFGWIGIECKYFERDGGSKIAKAHHQIISKYRGEKYIKNNKIDLWCLCPYFKGIEDRSRYGRNQQELRQTLIREMFCAHGIGVLMLNRRRLLLDFAYSHRASKIPISPDDGYYGYDDVDIQRIRDIVSRKIEKYNYT